MSTRLTPPQEECLEVLTRGAALTAAQVATARGWYPDAASNVARTLDRLTTMGLARTHTDARGRRRWSITDGGRQARRWTKDE